MYLAASMELISVGPEDAAGASAEAGRIGGQIAPREIQQRHRLRNHESFPLRS